MKMNKVHATIMAMFMLLPNPVQAQDTSRNYVRTVTMLNDDRTDSVQSVLYYNGLGWPAVSVTTVGANGQTAWITGTEFLICFPDYRQRIGNMINFSL